MARELGDVLHFFLDDAPCQESPAADAAALGRILARLDPPLEVLAAGVPGDGARLDAVAREPGGRGVVVMGADLEADASMLTTGLAQLDWLARSSAADPLRASLSDEPLGLVLISAQFPVALRRAAAHLGEFRVRLIRRFSSQGP